MPIAEVIVANKEISRFHFVLKLGVVAVHCYGGEFIDILNLDVLDADDLINVKVYFIEYEGGSSF